MAAGAAVNGTRNESLRDGEVGQASVAERSSPGDYLWPRIGPFRERVAVGLLSGVDVALGPLFQGGMLYRNLLGGAV